MVINCDGLPVAFETMMLVPQRRVLWYNIPQDQLGGRNVNRTEFDRIAETFADFHREFAPLFGRPKAVDHAEQYLRGLLVQQTDRPACSRQAQR